MFVGGRISDQTGDCEKVTDSWSQNQTLESGYGVVDKVYFKKDFLPPV